MRASCTRDGVLVTRQGGKYCPAVDLADHVPSWMLRVGPGDLAVWQWFGIAVSILAAWMVGRFLAFFTVWSALQLTSHTRTTFDDELISRLRSPLRAIATVGIVRVIIPLLDLHPGAHAVAMDILIASFALALVWGALRGIDVATARL